MIPTRKRCCAENESGAAENESGAVCGKTATHVVKSWTDYFLCADHIFAREPFVTIQQYWQDKCPEQTTDWDLF